MPRNICFIAGTLGQGGAERQLYYMLRALHEAGNDVTVLCLTQGEYWEWRIKALGVSVVNVGQWHARPLRLLRILDEVRRLRPDIIQSSHFYTNFPAAVAGKCFGIPAIGAVRADALREVAGLGKILGRLNLKAPRLIAGNSKAGLANARALRIPESRLFFLPNVIDCSAFRFKARSSQNPIRVLTAGRLVEQKRPDRFIRLISRLRANLGLPLRGIIAGDGPKRGELRRQMLDLGLTNAEVEFCGNTEDMKSLYDQADIFVLTSDWEGTPNVVIEAMACGVPVVSTDVGDVRSLIENGVSGFLVDANDEDDLVTRVTQLIHDPSQGQRFAQAARRHIENYCLTTLSERLDSLYRMAISGEVRRLPAT